jgi:two-component sensor histidine kinase
VLQTSLREKESLLKEMHHRVKSNLQIVSSMIRLQSGRRQHPETQSVLLDMQNRVQAMALIHEHLSQTENVATVDLGDYLKRLCVHLVHAFVTSPQVVELRQDIAPMRVGIEQAIPCGLLINELVSNCLKHAFPDGRAGEVSVALQPVADGPAWRLRVADNGVGLPAGFALEGLASAGLQLAPALARQIGGKLETGPGPGTVFEVVFTPVVACGG